MAVTPVRPFTIAGVDRLMHIQLPLAGKQRWSVNVDYLRRPTIAPSIWETDSCGAHFFVRKGELLWCA